MSLDDHGRSPASATALYQPPDGPPWQRHRTMGVTATGRLHISVTSPCGPPPSSPRRPRRPGGESASEAAGLARPVTVPLRRRARPPGRQGRRECVPAAREWSPPGGWRARWCASGGLHSGAHHPVGERRTSRHPERGAIHRAHRGGDGAPADEAPRSRRPHRAECTGVSLRQLEVVGQRAGVTGYRGPHAGRGLLSEE